MNGSIKNTYLFIFLLFFIIFISIVNLRLGSVWIPRENFWALFFSTNNVQPHFETILFSYRIPKLITAFLAGASLGLSGLLMQSLFRNPIVGPYILGLSGGSGLAVALVVMGGLAGLNIFHSDFIISLAAIVGSALVLLLDLLLFIKLKRTEILLIAGLMIGAFSSAVLSLLSFFAPARELQQYFFWTMGNLGNTSTLELWGLGITLIVIFFLSIGKSKFLNLMLLGDDYFKASGYSLLHMRLFIIITSGILTGFVTSITGPLVFVGLIVPHLARMIFKTEMHQYLIPAVILIGGGFMISTDIISQLPGQQGVLPINSITALIGAPLVIHLLIRNRN